MVGTLKPDALLASSAALLRRRVPSIDFVAKAICDWKSIKTSAWLRGDRSLELGTGLALIAMGDPFK